MTKENEPNIYVPQVEQEKQLLNGWLNYVIENKYSLTYKNDDADIEKGIIRVDNQGEEVELFIAQERIQPEGIPKWWPHTRDSDGNVEPVF